MEALKYSPLSPEISHETIADGFPDCSVTNSRESIKSEERLMQIKKKTGEENRKKWSFLPLQRCAKEQKMSDALNITPVAALHLSVAH